MTQTKLMSMVLLGFCLVSCGGGASDPVPLGEDNQGSSSGDDNGGDSGSGTPTTPGDTGTTPVTLSNQPPVANAGVDLTLVQGTSLTMSGSGVDSDGSISGYQWTQLSGETATINNSSAANTLVQLPAVDEAQQLEFQLTVTDNEGATDSDIMIVNLVLATVDPETGDTNRHPIADAGQDQVVLGGQEVTLTGAALDTDGQIQSYSWMQNSGPEEVTLSANDERIVTFTAPATGAEELYSFDLLVTDNEGATDSDRVTVRVIDELQAPQGLVAESSTTEMSLEWSPVDGAEGYNLYYANETFGEPADTENYAALDGGTLEADLTATTFRITEFVPSTKYFFVVTAVRGAFESSASNEVDVISGVDTGGGGEFPDPTGDINDTGQTLCFGNSAVQACGGNSFPGQDGDFGRDADPALEKVGSGDAGFDFIKVSASGAQLDVDQTEWACVLDNHTGLVWEVKSADNSVNSYSSSTFTWFSENVNTNGGNEGVESDPSVSECNLGNCNTAVFAAALVSANLCGRDDWRIPSLKELATLAHYNGGNPGIDWDFFPNVTQDQEDQCPYWTDTVFIEENEPELPSAWVFDFCSLSFYEASKSSAVQVRAVSGSPQ